MTHHDQTDNLEAIMSSWLKTNLKKTSATNLRPEEIARSTTPTPGNLHPDDGYGKKTGSRSGLLAIRVLWAEGLSVPYGTAFPPAVQNALLSQQARLAASVSPSSVTQQRLAKKGNRYVGSYIAYSLIINIIHRDSVQRAQCWWLPYLVMEYEVNQVLITALGGEIQKPVYMYQANL